VKSRSRIRALGAAVIAMLSGGLATQAGAVTIDTAPAAWVAYAQRASRQFQLALESDAAAAQRVQARFAQQASDATGEVPPILRVKVWFETSGRVNRVEFASLGNDAADADLRQVLLTTAIGAAPPEHMKQPVVVRLSVAAQL
jgi:hypothetical protein